MSQVSEHGRAYDPGGDTALGSSDAPGRFGFVRLPQGLRIVWHYVQDGGQRTYTLRYRLRGVVIAHDDAVEVAPQVWGNQWKNELHTLFANMHAAGDVRGTHAWIEPAWLGHRVTVRGGDVLSVVDSVPSGRSVTLRVLYPTSALVPGAPYARHVHDDVLAATIAREQKAAASAARDKRQLEDTLHHPWAWVIAAMLLALVPAGLLGGFAYWRFGREHPTGSAPEYVHEPPDDLAPALVPSLLAQRVVAGGDQLAATLFELVRRGRFKMTPVTREESSLAGLRHKEIDDVDIARGDESVELAVVEKPVAAIFDRLTGEAPVALSQVAKTVKGLSTADREWFHGRSQAFESAVRNQARQRVFWSGRGMLVKWLAFALFLLAGGRPAGARHRRPRRPAARAPRPDPDGGRRGARAQRPRRAACCLRPCGAGAGRRCRPRPSAGRASAITSTTSPGSPRSPRTRCRCGRATWSTGSRSASPSACSRRPRCSSPRSRIVRLRPGPLRRVVQRVELRERPRRRVPLALERRLGRRRRGRRLVRRGRRGRVVSARRERGAAPVAAGGGRRAPTRRRSGSCMAGDATAATPFLRESERLYRESWEAAPPGGYGRLVGMLKAAILRGDAGGAARYARAALGGTPESPTAAYALALTCLADGDDCGAAAAAMQMAAGGEAFARAAAAMAALAAGDENAYGVALEAVIADFAARDLHLTGVAIADTALVLERLAERAAWPGVPARRCCRRRSYQPRSPVAVMRSGTE